MIIRLSIPAEQWSRSLEALLILLGAIAVACLILIPQAGLLAIVGCAALGFVAIVNNVLRGRIDGLVSWWSALFPLTYFASFPREHPIVTPQRLVVLGAFMGLAITPFVRLWAPGGEILPLYDPYLLDHRAD